ncbi:MAG: tape measure protein [Capsulimonadales bacterium]|nr:tape measure protein [Capsulimonadales bacterium]
MANEKEAAVLLLRVRADAAQAKKELANVYAVATNQAKVSAREVLRIKELEARSILRQDEARAKSAARVAQAEANAATSIQRSVTQTLRAKQQTIRVEEEAARAAERSAQRRARANGGSNFALPRTFAGFSPAGALQGAMAAGGLYLAGQAAQLPGQIFETRATYEGLENALRALNGSAAKTEAQLIRLREVAQLPGLGFQEAVQGAIRLQGAGFQAEQAERHLRNFGKAVAQTGGGREEIEGVTLALAQMAAKTKVSAEEINQLAERIPSIRVAMQQAFGTSDTELIQAAGLDPKQAIAALSQIYERTKQVEGGLKNSKENIVDGFKEMFNEIGRAAQESGVNKLMDNMASLLRRGAGSVRQNTAVQREGRLLGDIISGRGSANGTPLPRQQQLIAQRLAQISQDLPAGFDPDRSNNSTLIQLARERESLLSYRRGLGMQSQYENLGASGKPFRMAAAPIIDVKQVSGLQAELSAIVGKIGKAKTAEQVSALAARAEAIARRIKSTHGISPDAANKSLQAVQVAAQDKLATLAEAAANDARAAAQIDAQRRLTTLSRTFGFALDEFEQARTPQEIERARQNAFGLMGRIRNAQGAAAQATYNRQVGTHPRTAASNLMAAKADILADNADRAKSVREATERAGKRLQDEATEQQRIIDQIYQMLDEEDEEAEKRRKKQVQEEIRRIDEAREADEKLRQALLDGLRVDEDTLRLQLERANNFEEAQRIIAQIVDNLQSQAMNDYFGTMFTDPTAQNRLDRSGIRIAQTARELTDKASGQFQETDLTANQMPTITSMDDDHYQVVQPDGSVLTVDRDTYLRYRRDYERRDRRSRRARDLRESGRRMEQNVENATGEFLGDLTRGNVEGAGRSAVMAIVDSLRREGGDLIAREISRAIKQPIGETFRDIADALNKNISGLNISAKNLLMAGASLAGLANLLGAGGKKKQKKSVLGGIAGAVVGSFIPGGSLLTDIGIGAFAGGFFAEGGRPPIGRASWVGDGKGWMGAPELIVPQEPSVVLNERQIKAVQNKLGGGKSTTIHIGTIHDRADADYLIRHIDDRNDRRSYLPVTES